MINTWSWHYVSAFVTNRGVFCDCAIQCLQLSRQSHLFSSKMLIEYSYLISFMLMEYELIKFSYYLCSTKQNQSLDTLISSWGFASLKTSDPQAECQHVAINEVLVVFSATLKVVHIYIRGEAFLLDPEVTHHPALAFSKAAFLSSWCFHPLQMGFLLWWLNYFCLHFHGMTNHRLTVVGWMLAKFSSTFSFAGL